MERKILRKKGARWCEVEISLEDGRLSISGSEGRIVKRTVAKKEALAYWRQFFEDDRAQIASMNERCGTRFTSPTGAARYVLANDGALHGLDVHGPEDANEIMITESCGQIVDTIATFFPEVMPLLPYHLNDMKPSCVHQEAEGWDKRPIDPSKPTNTYGLHYPGQRQPSWNMLTWVRRGEHPEGLLCHPCPTCGYKYGTAWMKRELPAEIVKLAESIAA